MDRLCHTAFQEHLRCFSPSADVISFEYFRTEGFPEIDSDDFDDEYYATQMPCGYRSPTDASQPEGETIPPGADDKVKGNTYEGCLRRVKKKRRKTRSERPDAGQLVQLFPATAEQRVPQASLRVEPAQVISLFSADQAGDESTRFRRIHVTEEPSVSPVAQPGGISLLGNLTQRAGQMMNQLTARANEVAPRVEDQIMEMLGFREPRVEEQRNDMAGNTMPEPGTGTLPVGTTTTNQAIPRWETNTEAAREHIARELDKLRAAQTHPATSMGGPGHMTAPRPSFETPTHDQNTAGEMDAKTAQLIAAIEQTVCGATGQCDTIEKLPRPENTNDHIPHVSNARRPDGNRPLAAPPGVCRPQHPGQRAPADPVPCWDQLRACGCYERPGAKGGPFRFDPCAPSTGEICGFRHGPSGVLYNESVGANKGCNCGFRPAGPTGGFCNDKSGGLRHENGPTGGFYNEVTLDGLVDTNDARYNPYTACAGKSMRYPSPDHEYFTTVRNSQAPPCGMENFTTGRNSQIDWCACQSESILCTETPCAYHDRMACEILAKYCITDLKLVDNYEGEGCDGYEGE